MSKNRDRAEKADPKGIADKGMADKGTADKGVAPEFRRLMAVEELLQDLPSGAWEGAQNQLFPLFKEVGKNYVEELAEETIPYAQMVIIAGKVANGFGEGVRRGIMAARAELRWDALIASIGSEALTEQDIATIQRIRAWQKENVARFPDVICEGIKSALRALADELVEEIVSVVLGRMAERLARKVGDFVGDILTGDYIKRVNIISQRTEDLVEDIVTFHTKLLYISLAQAVATRALAEGLEADVNAAMASEEIPDSLRGLSPAVQEELARQAEYQIKLNALTKDLWSKLTAEALREQKELEALRVRIIETNKAADVIIIGEAYRMEPEYQEGQLRIYQEHERQIAKIDRSFQKAKFKLNQEYGVVTY